MKKIIFLAVLTLNFELGTLNSFSQNVGINVAGSVPDNSAILDVSSTTKGLLLPRMTTTERNAIPSPITSLLIFNTTTNCLEMYVNGGWYTLSCPSACVPPATPTATAATSITTSGFTANWGSITGATTYYLDVSLNSGFSTFVSGYNNLNVGNVVSSAVTTLTCNTAYYYRVRSATACSSVSSNIITTTTSACPPPPPTCGSQVWASTNLNVGTRINGGTDQTHDGTVEKWCYNNLESNCDIYGGLYDWDEAMTYSTVVTFSCDPCGSSGIQANCPAGFHIPTDLEWARWEYCIENTIAPTGSTTLATFQTTGGWRGSSTAGVGPGDKMKVTSSNSPAWNGTNTSGFAALPAGFYNVGPFTNLGSYAYYWSATVYSSSDAYARYMNTDNGAQVFRTLGINKDYGYSVRCLQN